MLFECLELDREATLIELAQAERRCEGSESYAELNDDVQSNRPPAYDAVEPSVNQENASLLESAREEILAIRSSLPRTVGIDAEALESKIIRHSRRISSMLEGDKAKLSQRWSVTLQDNSEVSSSPSQEASVKRHLGPSPTNISRPAQTKILNLNDVYRRTPDGSGFDPRSVVQYKTFLSWLTQLEMSFRKIVIRALKEDARQWREHDTGHTGQSSCLTS